LVLRLIKDFSTRETLPVEVDDVIKEIVSRGIKDEVYYFWDHNLNPKVLMGYIKHDEYPTGGGKSKLVAEITYAKLGHEMERLVCCKELLHLLDPIDCRATQKDEVEKLIEKIILPPELVDPFTDGIHASTDRIAIIHAVAVLFPLAAQNILLPKYAEKNLHLPTLPISQNFHSDMWHW
jgi:hypothetical protein